MANLVVGPLAFASVEHFVMAGSTIMNRAPKASSRSFQERWTSHFQVAPLVLTVVWHQVIPYLDRSLQNSACIEHLLWAVLFLRVYREETVLAGMCGCDEDTFRKWVWIFIALMADLEQEVICFENRKIGDKGKRDCFLDVDGVDCMTTKQGKRLKPFYGHKFKTSGLRYGVATCIVTGDICHIDGPHPPGDWNDLMCFRRYLKPKLDEGERVEADDGYGGEDPESTVTPQGLRYLAKWIIKTARGRIRSRHETVNERLKQFHVLSGKFHHAIEKHGDCFRSCAVLTQLSFGYDKHPYEIEDALERAGY